eukprot:g2417.t1
MVCPLRFVLVFFSAAIAAVGIYQTFWAEEPSEEDKRRQREHAERRKRMSWPAWIWSFFNGQYIYEYYKAHQPSNPQDAKAADPVAVGLSESEGEGRDSSQAMRKAGAAASSDGMGTVVAVMVGAAACAAGIVYAMEGGGG